MRRVQYRRNSYDQKRSRLLWDEQYLEMAWGRTQRAAAQLEESSHDLSQKHHHRGDFSISSLSLLPFY